MFLSFYWYSYACKWLCSVLICASYALSLAVFLYFICANSIYFHFISFYVLFNYSLYAWFMFLTRDEKGMDLNGKGSGEFLWRDGERES